VLVVLQVAAMAVFYFARRIRPSTVLTLRLEGDIPEQAPDSLREWIGGPTTTVADITEALDRARTDPHITGVEVRVSETTMSMGKIQEVRDAIRDFTRAGKFSVAYLDFATNSSYYLASACHTVYLLPKSLFYVRGLMASTTFLRGTFDKLGIYPDFLHIGDYKNATNVYTEKKYTAPHREATQALVDDWYHEYVAGVAEARELNPAAVEKTIAAGPYNSDAVPATLLVDRVAYSDDARRFVEQLNHGVDRRIGLRTYLERTEASSATQLAVVYATGDIVPGHGGDSPLGSQLMGADTVAEQLRRAREDDSVRAIVLRVDSPGGVAFASEVIRHEVELAKRSKPVVVSMSDVAASGGYWIAMSANRIIAEPGTITGSIGVLTGKFNLLGLYEKLGMSKDFVSTTENSTFDYAFHNFTPAQRDNVMKNMRATYNSFLDGVAAGRGMKVADVDKIAQGRVWTGERALKLGLVDELGGLHKAIARARQLAKIPADEKVSVVFLPPRRSLLERLMGLSGEGEAIAGQLSPRAWLRTLEMLGRYQVWTVLSGVPQLE